MGIDTNDQIYILHIYKGTGISANEQISKIVQLSNAFRPNERVFEGNDYDVRDISIREGERR